MNSYTTSRGSDRSLLQKPPTSEEFVYHALRTEILSGYLKPAERVIQSQCAQRFGVSVTPVREALRRLQSEGMVDIIAHVGATVRQLSMHDAREIYQLRILIEPIAIEHAIADRHQGEIQEAARLCERMDDTDDLSEWIDHNRVFHELLMTSEDSWMSRVLNMLRSAAAPFVGLSLLADPTIRHTSNMEHRALVRAFETRDVEQGKSITAHHLRATLDALECAHTAGHLL